MLCLWNAVSTKKRSKNQSVNQSVSARTPGLDNNKSKYKTPDIISQGRTATTRLIKLTHQNRKWTNFNAMRWYRWKSYTNRGMRYIKEGDTMMKKCIVNYLCNIQRRSVSAYQLQSVDWYRSMNTTRCSTNCMISCSCECSSWKLFVLLCSTVLLARHCALGSVGVNSNDDTDESPITSSSGFEPGTTPMSLVYTTRWHSFRRASRSCMPHKWRHVHYIRDDPPPPPYIVWYIVYRLYSA